MAEAYKLAVEDRGWIRNEETGPIMAHWRHEDAPRLADVVRILETTPSPTSKSLAEMLRPYAQGVYASYFNTPTTFDIAEEQLVIFGLQHVNDMSDQLRVYLWQVMGLIWGEVIRRNATDPQAIQHVMLDEVWKLLEAPGGAGAVENMARRFRKRRTALWLATQQVGEFLDAPAGRRILSVVGNTILMEQRPVEAKRLQATFDLSDYMTDSLHRLGTGHGVLVTPEGNLRIWIAAPEGWGIY
jgi:type IV secretory pathway VirB4 component